MPVTLEDSWAFPGIPPRQLFRTRNRLDYLHAKGDALQQQDFRVLELRERGGRFRCVTQMQVDVVLPAWARHVLRPRVEVVQHEVWHPPLPDGGMRYDILVDIRNSPVRATGQGTLSLLDWTGTDYHVRIEVTGTRRLLRERVERFAADQLHERMVEERAFALRWFAMPHAAPALPAALAPGPHRPGPA